MWLLDKMLRRLVRKGRLRVTDYDGSVHGYGSGDDEVLAARLTDRRTAAKIARHPDVGAGEAYMDGHLIIEPPHDIRDLVQFLSAQGQDELLLEPPGRVRRFADRIAARADQINRRGRSRRNVAHHYELGRNFYELFLDQDLQYSMAYWRDPDDTLERAQRDKLALIASKLRLQPGMRVLDIGCGWGGLSLYLHRHFGCEVLGISLSEDQVRTARQRAAAEGVADRVKFELMDYRDLHDRFDRITSVGMFEHVGAPQFREYFACTRELLADDGVMLTHTIGRSGPPSTTDKWTRKYIFPGGYIPAMSEMIAAMEDTGWKVCDVEILRLHYAYTLAEWYRRTCRREAEITALYDARLFRMWQFYLAGAERAFRSGELVNFHVQAAKRIDTLPLTREYIGDASARLNDGDARPARARATSRNEATA